MSNIFPNVKERVLHLIVHKGYKREEFFKKIGMTYGNFTGKAKETPLNSNAIGNILLEIPDANIEWLITGNGEMLKNEIKQSFYSEKNTEIPLISLEAVSNYGKSDPQKIKYDLVDGYKIPELDGKGVEYLIRVSGSSMHPIYSNGDLLACRPLTDFTFFQWGKAYVLDTEQGTIVKRLFPNEDDNDYLECHSDNKISYPPFKIPKSSVKNVAIVVGVIRLE